MIPALDAFIARLEAELAAETASIAQMVAAKQIGNGCGYWKRRHELECKLRVATRLSDALADVAL